MYVHVVDITRFLIMPSKKSTKQNTQPPPALHVAVSHGAIFPATPTKLDLPASYPRTLQEIKTHLRTARVRVVLAANPILIEAYLQTGKYMSSSAPEGSRLGCEGH